MPLISARDEQAWIEGRIGAGVARTQGAMALYSTPALIYGRRGQGDAAVAQRAAQAGCEFVQRRAGGGVVMAGPWLLGLDLLLPPSHAVSQGGHVAAFQWFGARLREALQGLDVPCAVASPEQIAAHNAAARAAGVEWICFAGLSYGELLDAHGRKLLGLAQCRGRWGSLISAGLLLAPTPWETVESVHLGRPCAASAMHRQASAGLASLAPALSPGRVGRALLDVLSAGERVEREDSLALH